jgi:hypothetical protein
VTPFRIDVTDRVLVAVRNLLESGLVKIDEGVAGWDSRSRFEQLWRTLQRPVRFTDSVYMIMAPTRAQLGPITARGNTVIARLRLVAAPRVVTGPYPNEFELMTPMPRLGPYARVGEGAHVQLEGSLAYPVAKALLSRVVVGREFEQAGRRLKIEDIDVMGIGGGQVALGVTVSGAVHGPERRCRKREPPRTRLRVVEGRRDAKLPAQPRTRIRRGPDRASTRTR